MFKALFFLTSHSQLGDTGRATGWYLPETAHPWKEFVTAGWDVGFVSTYGGRQKMDGVDLDDPIQAEFLAEYGELGPDTVSADQIDAADVDVVLYVGGHGTMWDFPDNERLSAISRSVWENGGVVSAVCHGPAGLVGLRLSDGTPLVHGRRLAAFTDDEERAAGLAETVPFLLASKLMSQGALHVPAANWESHVIVDGRLITGQNPASATALAKAIVAKVGELKVARTR
jgi:putative intracellular protease/amidase